jgi:hypothetical protein
MEKSSRLSVLELMTVHDGSWLRIREVPVFYLSHVPTSLLPSSWGDTNYGAYIVTPSPTFTSLSIPLANLIFSCKSTKSLQLNRCNDASSYFVCGIGLVDRNTATQPSDNTFHQGSCIVAIPVCNPAMLLANTTQARWL